MTPTTLPPELIKAIVDDLALQKDTTALTACALTCKFMNFCSRKHLFSTIHMGAIPSLKSHCGGTPRIEQLVSLLNHSPEIADCIKEFSYKLWHRDYEDQTAPVVLKRLTKVRSLTLVRLAQFMLWKFVPVRFQEAMAHLIQLPSEMKLVLRLCHNIPMALFMSCPNLTQLKLENMELQDTDLINLVLNQVPHNPPRIKHFSFSDSSSTSLEKLLQTRRPDSLPFFDFSELLHLSLIPTYGNIGNSAETIMKGDETTYFSYLSRSAPTPTSRSPSYADTPFVVNRYGNEPNHTPSAFNNPKMPQCQTHHQRHEPRAAVWTFPGTEIAGRNEHP